VYGRNERGDEESEQGEANDVLAHGPYSR